jgi:hypothetical protein
MKRDPIEQSPEYLAIEDELEAKILKRMETMKYSPRERGRLYDKLQKEILKKCRRCGDHFENVLIYNKRVNQKKVR